MLQTLITLLLLSPAHPQTQRQLIPSLQTFSSSSLQQTTLTTLPASQNSQQFSIWGWFKSDTNTNQLISVVQLETLLLSESNAEGVDLFPDSNSPSCPYSEIQIRNDPGLRSNEDFNTNRNCQPQNFKNVRIDGQVYQRMESVLYLTYQNTEGGKADFVFYVPQEMQNDALGYHKLQLELQVAEGQWFYFAASMSFKDEHGTVYIQQTSDENSETKEFSMDLSTFRLQPAVRLYLSPFTNNPLFEPQAPF